MKNNIRTITIVRIIAIVMLFWALGSNPYGYYQILRWVVAGTTGYLAYLSYNEGKHAWTWIMAIIAALFNPIAPIYLNRETWSVLNILVAIIIFISMFKLRIIKK